MLANFHEVMSLGTFSCRSSQLIRLGSFRAVLAHRESDSILDPFLRPLRVEVKTNLFVQNMLNSHQAQRFDGDYDKFLDTWNHLEYLISGTNIKFKKIQQNGEINCRGIFLLALVSNCPAKDVDYANGWNVKQICDQNDIDRPDPNNAYYREALEEFEDEVFNNQEKKDVVQFLSTVFAQVIAPFFNPQLPEMLKIDRTDPFFVIRFLQSVYTNYLNHVKLNNSGIVTGILDKSRSWKSGSAAEFKQHLCDIQAMMARLPPSLRSTCDQNLIINMVISNLKDDPNLDALHTVIRSKYNDSPVRLHTLSAK